MKIFFEKLEKKYLFLSGLFSILVCINGNQAFGQQENLNLLNTWIKGTNSGVMLLNFLNNQAFTYLDLRDKEISKLKTKADWVNRQLKVKNILNEIVGPFPAKTPLNPRITGILKKDGFKVEKIIFESIPGFYVTGCLFIPDGIVGKRPAILDNIGHAEGSFRNERYQNVIHNLVKKGFIVFAIDPVGQGEKDEYYDPLLKKSVIEEGVPAHCYFGDQCYVSGFSSAKYFIWDAVRAIDYLLSRKEVDASRIGATGLSGGGTVTSYLCAFDERIKAAAPYNWAIFDRGLLETVGVQDAEANVYHGLMKGLTFADFLEMRAPKPTLMIKTTRDYLPIQGAREAYQEISKAYKAFGQEENLLMVEDDAEHQFTRKNNEATYAFFQKYLELPGDPNEVKVEMLSPEELRVSPTGLVLTQSNAETVFSLNRKATEELLKSIAESRKNIKIHLEKVRIKAAELSGYLTPENKSESVFSGRYKRNGYSVEKYVLPGEGNCIIPLLLFIPDGHRKFPLVIYLHPDGKAAESPVGGQIEDLVKQGYIVAAPDLSGTGETSNKFRPDKDAIIENYNAVLTGRSIVGIRAGDIIRVNSFLNARDDVDKDKIGAIAMGQMGPALLHAAVFDKSIKHIVLLGSPLSYRSIVLNKFYKISFECTVAGALTAYDLPDLIGCISPERVLLVQPKDHMLNSASQELINQELQFPLRIYSQKNVPGNLKVLTTSENPGQLMKWCFE
jgi:cephalosporin-C deacetylase-like acetyl esterase